MGTILGCRCEKCNFKYSAWVGYGWLYPDWCVKTIKQIKNGMYGEHLEDFVNTFPNGGVSCETVVIQCDNCGKLNTALDLTTYVPVDDSYVSDDRSFMLYDLNDHYIEFEKYHHKCPVCGGSARIVPGFTRNFHKETDRHVRCPNCSNSIEIIEIGCWD